MIITVLFRNKFSSILQCVTIEKLNRGYKINSVLSKLVQEQCNLVKVWSSNLIHAKIILK